MDAATFQRGISAIDWEMGIDRFCEEILGVECRDDAWQEEMFLAMRNIAKGTARFDSDNFRRLFEAIDEYGRI